ncbi:MAG: TerB family tellurite resistance protein [Gammaproteobacteria bacterium]|nr:TerB family tellurite resistance protein [Gammaproteobacteria bacterium]
MALADLSSVLKIFGESPVNPEEQQRLYGEVLMMVLARAASSDTNVHADEIEMIQGIVERETGEKITAADIRIAARPELYESVPLRKYLKTVRRKMRPEDCLKVVNALADVIRSDTAISVLEVDFLNRVSDSLRVTPAELMGIHA